MIFAHFNGQISASIETCPYCFMQLVFWLNLKSWHRSGQIDGQIAPDFQTCPYLKNNTPYIYGQPICFISILNHVTRLHIGHPFTNLALGMENLLKIKKGWRQARWLLLACYRRPSFFYEKNVLQFWLNYVRTMLQFHVLDLISNLTVVKRPLSKKCIITKGQKKNRT